jgi:hypothetical protein
MDSVAKMGRVSFLIGELCGEDELDSSKKVWLGKY